MDARSGDTFRNVEQLLNAHRKAYKALQNPRAIDAENMLKNHSAKEVNIQDEVNAVARQRDISAKRNEVDTGQRPATSAELHSLAPKEPYEDDPGDAIRVDVSQLGVSPAE